MSNTLKSKSMKYNGKSSESTNTADKRTSSSNEMLEKVPIEGTPFHAIRFDQKWFLTMGHYRISEEMNSLKEVQEDAKDASWIRIMQIMNIMIKENYAEILAEAGKHFQPINK
ncbi:MAG: hypothetical protein [Microviridae sp.]|nr:MAG: hypothetical protein [Microviridae sp.]